MSISPDQIARWGTAPDETTELKCQRTVERIKRSLTTRFPTDVEIYLQGSYRNRTNVRTDSDVDIVVEHTGYFFHDLSSLSVEEKHRYEALRIPTDYSFTQFKADVLAELQREFGAAIVTPKKKCIFVAKDAYRVDADVVPCYTHKRFSTATTVQVQGIAFVSSDGQIHNSFPKQHYENGASKNLITDGRYKAAVRALKCVMNNLQDSGIQAAKDMRSFLLECLIWNMPNNHFSATETLHENLRRVIAKIYNDMDKPDAVASYAEVSDLKWLLRGGNASANVQIAKAFMLAAWRYIGYQ